MKKYISLFVIIGLVIAVNIFSVFASYRMDFTEGKIYTLSQSTKEIIKNLPDNIEVQVFMSKNLPPQAAIVRQQLEDKLADYQAIAGNKLQVTYQDPANNDALINRMRYLGIPELQLQVIEKDQRQVVRAYMGLAVLKTQEASPEDLEQNPIADVENFTALPVIQNLDSFEYDMTSALLKMSSSAEKVVGFLVGHGEHAPYVENRFNSESNPRADYDIKDTLAKTYATQEVDLINDPESIAEVNTLIIAGPQENITDEEASIIHNFVNNGGNMIVMIDTVNAGQGLLPSAVEANFDNLLSPYGVGLDTSVIADASHESASFSQGFFTISLPYPFWVKADKNQLNSDNSITSQIESLTLPWATPIHTIEKKEHMTSLVTSSSQYQIISENIDLNPQQDFALTGNPQTPVDLAVLIENDKQGKVIVIGDSDFASMNFSGIFPGNTLFFQNLVDGVTLGDALINIRSKGVTDRPLSKNITEVTKNFIRWGNIIFIPLLFVGYGLLRKFLRNTRKKAAHIS